MPLSENIKLDDSKTPISLKETLAKIQARLNNPIVQALVGEIKRPKGARLISNYPYYRERFALEFKGVLDEMLAEYESGKLENRAYFYNDFPDVRPNTLYLRVTQSRMYLLDRLDPDKKYAAFCELVSITRPAKLGAICLGYNKDLVTGGSFKPSMIPVAAKLNEWKEKLEAFLENSIEDEELTISKLALDEEEIAVLKLSLDQLENIAHRITSKEIWVANIGMPTE